jgi:hypothetical protein
MGNNVCCETKRYVVDFNQCFDLKCVTLVLASELKRINRISKAITFKNTLSDIKDHTLFREHSELEMRKFQYYLKLGMVLAKIKNFLEENSIPNRYLSQPNQSKNSSNKLVRVSDNNLISLKSKHIFEGESERPKWEQESKDYSQLEPQKFIERRFKRSYTSKHALTQQTKLKVTIDLQKCINFLTEIMDTEEHYDEEILERLDSSIENRLCCL